MALAALGADANQPLSGLDTSRKAALVDKLVRNLKLPMEATPPVERELLTTLHAGPSGTYEWRIDSAQATVELRSGLRYLATWLGFTWQELSRLQAVLGNLVRWIQTAGTGHVEAHVEPKAVRFSLSLAVPGINADVVRTSPFVTALADLTQALAVSRHGEAIRLDFALVAR